MRKWPKSKSSGNVHDTITFEVSLVITFFKKNECFQAYCKKVEGKWYQKKKLAFKPEEKGENDSNKNACDKNFIIKIGWKIKNGKSQIKAF